MKEPSAFKQPLIILGFHHSGTRLLAELLAQCGLFQVSPTTTYEWKYFQDLNDRIWESWWDLKGISEAELQSRSDRIDEQEILDGLVSHGYKNGVWGFKDPRTCITLATWLKVFPNAKAVHIIRDPRDVLGTLPEAYSKFTPHQALPQDDLQFWSDLWVNNINMIENVGSNCASFTTLKYEDLCSAPLQELARIVDDLGMSKELRVEKAQIGAISSKEKKYINWLRDGKLQIEQIEQIETITKTHMEQYGYNDRTSRFDH